MAANTITGYQALFKIAEEIGKTRSAHITTATSTTQVTCAGLSGIATSNQYRYGLARILGKGISVVQTNDANGVFTFSPAFTSAPVVGDTLELALWNANELGKAKEALNEAVRLSYPYWYQETIYDNSASTITLATATDSYTLPSNTSAVIAVGVQATNQPIKWITPYNQQTKQKAWTVEGQAGAYVIRFHPHYARVGFHQMYSGKKLCYWIAIRESEFAALTGTTQLPVDYFTVGAEVYRRRELNDATRAELAAASVALPQLQQVAQTELQRLGIGKRPPNEVLLNSQIDNAYEVVADTEVLQQVQPKKTKAR